jgi:sugar lactone lactonase YvrE
MTDAAVQDAARLCVDCRNALGEMPLWCERSGTLYWIDVLRPGRVFHWQLASDAIDFWQFDQLITGVNLDAAGGLLVHGTRDIWRFNPASGQTTALHSLAAAPDASMPIRFNDGHCDAAGRLWVGTMYNNIDEQGAARDIPAPIGGLLVIDAAGATHSEATRSEEAFGCPNALCWSPDGETMYAADSCDGWLYAYHFDVVAGRLSQRRQFCYLDGLGIPDGAAVDADGYLWNARWGAGVVARISPEGQLDRLVRVAASQPTACCFGGPDRRTLYVTSARFGLSAQQLQAEPEAGGVFSIAVDVPGIELAAFAMKDT